MYKCKVDELIMYVCLCKTRFTMRTVQMVYLLFTQLQLKSLQAQQFVVSGFSAIAVESVVRMYGHAKALIA